MMLHIVQFSLGAGSAVAAKLVIDEYGHDNTVLMWHDTKAEHPDSARFAQQVSDYLNHPITEVSDGRDLWQLIDDHHCLPSDRIPFCSGDLKGDPAAKYYKSLLAEGHTFVLYNGMGPDEHLRAQNTLARETARGYAIRFPLIEHRVFQPKEVVKSWGICLPSAYEHLPHNNCIPCFKAKDRGYWYAIWKHYPEQYWKAEAMERKWNHTVLPTISLAELALIFAQSDTPPLMEFDPPCSCMA